MEQEPKPPKLTSSTEWNQYTIDKIQSLVVSEQYEEALRQAELRKSELERLLEATPLESGSVYSQEEWGSQRQGLEEEISELRILIKTIEAEITND
jgi:hypothetical protein